MIVLGGFVLGIIGLWSAAPRRDGHAMTVGSWAHGDRRPEDAAGNGEAAPMPAMIRGKGG